MSSPAFNSYIPPDSSIYGTPTPASRGRGGTGAKRGRKPKALLAAQAAAAAANEAAKSPLSQEISGPSTPTTLTWQSTMVPAPTRGSSSGGMLSLPGATAMAPPATSSNPAAPAAPMDEDGEDELLPAMADDDYSAQLSWQSQSKDNLKCVDIVPLSDSNSFSACRVLMDNFTPEQYDRFEAYRRHALPKQAVRKVC
jgi:transcription initiation factor TFIID subunit 11